jgi:hypothetical protein
MCKINGHNLFTYAFQPAWNWKKLATSKERGERTAAAKANASFLEKRLILYLPP